MALTVAGVFGLRSVHEGLKFGVEIEVEGERLPSVAAKELRMLWSSKPEPSLRGESCEYIFRDAFVPELSKEAVVKLYTAFNESVIYDSFRAGTHCHVNVSDLTLDKLGNFCFLWYLLEEVLVDQTNETRVGNHHCCRLLDSYGTVELWNSSLREKCCSRLSDSTYKYSALNLSNLGRFGTVEFRFLPTFLNDYELVYWLDVFEELYYVALRFENPYKMYVEFRDLGAKDFLTNHFSSAIVEHVKAVQGYSVKMWRSFCFAQDVVFGNEESVWGEGFKTKPSLFGAFLNTPQPMEGPFEDAADEEEEEPPFEDIDNEEETI